MAFAGSTSHSGEEPRGKAGTRPRGTAGRGDERAATDRQSALHDGGLADVADVPARARSRSRTVEGQRNTLRHEDRSTAADLGATADTVTRPRGRPFSEERNWRQWGAVGTGVALGALVGAGIALLMAPQDGAATRQALRRASRKAGVRAADAWADLGDDLWFAGARARRQLRRGVSRRRWQAEDWMADLGHRGRSAMSRRTRGLRRRRLASAG